MAASAALDRAPIRTAAGHARSYTDTERRLTPLLARAGITRLHDVTALDRLGLPVWAAVTPLAADLTVHAGKGPSAQAARISAAMEAIERVCAEDLYGARTRRAGYAELRAEDPDGALDPARCDLPFTTRYQPERSCRWVRGERVPDGAPVWVAADLVVSPAREGICQGPETNGLAAGNTVLEATLHALYEVIERDAAAERTIRRLYGEGDAAWPLRLLADDGLPVAVAAWVGRLREAGLEVTLEDLTHDIGVPVFRAALRDREFPGREGRSTGFEGFGADLDAANALLRAVSEAVQSHTAVLLGARESFEGAGGQPVTGARLLAWLLAPCERMAFDPGPAPPADLATRLDVVLERLRAAGLPECVRVELTRPDLGIPVVRVLVPGAAGPFGHTTRRPPWRLLRHLL